MTKCDDGCGRYACKTWDTRDPEVRQRFKALCGQCWTVRHVMKISVCSGVQAEPTAAPEATSQG